MALSRPERMGFQRPWGRRTMNRVLSLAWAGLTATSLLSAEEPKLSNTLEGHSKRVYCVAWSPDAKTLASGSADGTAKLWNLASGRSIATLRARPIEDELSVVTSVAWSPDGKRLAGGSPE